MEKRKWHYIIPPWGFEMRCDKCWGDINKTGSNITWSEFEHKIWCYDCEKDISGFQGIFDGPISLGIVYTLGLHFDRINLETNKIELLNLTSTIDPLRNKLKEDEEYLVYDELTNDIIKSITKLLLEGKEDPYGEYIMQEATKSIQCQYFERPYLHKDFQIDK